jgi:hypothetical protein
MGGNRFDEAIHSLAALVESSSLIANVKFVEELSNYWPDVSPQITVYRRFVLELEEVIAGTPPNDKRVIVFVPGGIKAEWGNPQPGGSFKPVPGEPTVEEVRAGYPGFSRNRDELVFLMRTTIQDGSEVWWATPEGRYEVVNGEVRSIFLDVPTDPAKLTQRDAKSDVVGKAYEAVRSEVVALADGR